MGFHAFLVLFAAIVATVIAKPVSDEPPTTVEGAMRTGTGSTPTPFDFHSTTPVTEVVRERSEDEGFTQSPMEMPKEFQAENHRLIPFMIPQHPMPYFPPDMSEMTTEMRRFLQMHQRHFLPLTPIFENFGFGGRQGPMGEEMQTSTRKPTGKPEVRATQTSPPKEVEESTMKSDSSTKMSEESEMMARVNPIQMPTEEQEEERPEENPMQMPMEELEGERPEENPMQMPTEGEERPEGYPMQMPMEEQDEERPEGNPMQMPIEEQEEERPEGNPMMEQAMIAQMEREQQPQSDLQEREETMDGFPRDEGRPRMEQNHEFLFSMPPQFGSSMIRLGDYINTGKPREQQEEKEQPEGLEGLREGEEPRNYERPPMQQNGDFLFSLPHYGMPMYRSQERPEDDESNVVEGGAELWLGNRPRHEQMPQIW